MSQTVAYNGHVETCQQMCVCGYSEIVIKQRNRLQKQTKGNTARMRGPPLDDDDQISGILPQLGRLRSDTAKHFTKKKKKNAFSTN